ncbi:MAG: L-2-amino-thiazoline-4-carboxylic acid hydrolase [Deltaproteobacteria bacterium]|nr:MAG: L-2-amino-thiazoline-4-carboxylic acid hydrolase [Deltaproteobacteria bacterium]
MKVEELSQYGKTLSGLPKEALKKQKAIVLREIRTKYGLLGILPFFIKILLGQKALKENYPEAYHEALNVSENAAKEITMLISIFNIIARKEGKENAYNFLKNIFQEVARYSMPALYQIDDLAKCEGDVFENFVKFNIAWFNAMNDEGTWIVDNIEEEKDKLIIIVTECANCVVGKAFDCPEIAKLGCDHDLAGYPVILDRVNAEFRRPHTIAKGDEYCDFMFYRKGTAPDTEHLNK